MCLEKLINNGISWVNRVLSWGNHSCLDFCSFYSCTQLWNQQLLGCSLFEYFYSNICISTKDVFNYFNAHKVQERKILLTWREHGSHLKAHFLSTKYSSQNADRFLYLKLLQKEHIARVLSKPKMNMCNKYLYYYYYLIF